MRAISQAVGEVEGVTKAKSHLPGLIKAAEQRWHHTKGNGDQTNAGQIKDPENKQKDEQARGLLQAGTKQCSRYRDTDIRVTGLPIVGMALHLRIFMPQQLSIGIFGSAFNSIFASMPCVAEEFFTQFVGLGGPEVSNGNNGIIAACGFDAQLSQSEEPWKKWLYDIHSLDIFALSTAGGFAEYAVLVGYFFADTKAGGAPPDPRKHPR
ncbi:hypothetical protein GCM10007338_11290 [Corynebacterium pelargi]|nr:hypothetical protein GCM10007338_11290 [Corynebacterium pelargi]